MLRKFFVLFILFSFISAHPVIFKNEIEKLKELNVDLKEKLIISRKAHLILPTHRLIDQASELSKGKKKIGSTLKGIGPTYSSKAQRNGIRIADLVHDFEVFQEKYRNLAEYQMQRYPDLKIDIDSDIETYKVSVILNSLLPLLEQLDI